MIEIDLYWTLIGQVIVGNNLFSASYLESQDKSGFVDDIGPYFQNAQATNESSEFLLKASAIWFELWPLRFADYGDDFEAYHRDNGIRTKVSLSHQFVIHANIFIT